MKKQNWFKKHEKAAAAGFCAVVLGITGVTAYQLQAVHAETYCWKEDSGASSEKELQEGRAERLDKIREKVLELEKYDVTFDNKEQAVYYDGRKVRWLMDELRDGTDAKDYIYCVDGDIDICTERNENGVLKGVRVVEDETDPYGDTAAFENGYVMGDREDWEKEAKELEDKYGGLYLFSVETAEDAAEVTEAVHNSAEAMDDVQIVVEAAEGTDTDSDYSIARKHNDSKGCVSGAESVTVEDFPGVYEEESNVLFESLGLKWDKNGYWTYNDKKVKVIWVADGSFSSYGNVTDGTYLYISIDNGQGQASFHVEELTRDEMQKIYQESHPGSFIP